MKMKKEVYEYVEDMEPEEKIPENAHITVYEIELDDEEITEACTFESLKAELLSLKKELELLKKELELLKNQKV